VVTRRGLCVNRLKGKCVLVTGAAGFIGANLVRALLRENAVVHALIRPRSRPWRLADVLSRLVLHRVDLNDFSRLGPAVREMRPHILFHLALPSGHPSTYRENIDMLRTSVLGTANLLEATASADFQRFVHIGSSLEYGPRESPHRESDPLAPVTPRGAAKAAATLQCRQFAHANGRPAVVLRLFSVYGYWEAPTRLVPTAICAAINRGTMRMTGPGYVRDMIFVDDVVNACVRATQTDLAPGEIINVGSGTQSSNEEVIATIEELCGREIRVERGTYPPSPSDTDHWVADIRKARKLLGWEPQHTLREGLEKTIHWMRRHRSLYDAIG
jgi:nucleoside-diphosphate-sugar epimerase